MAVPGSIPRSISRGVSRYAPDGPFGGLVSGASMLLAAESQGLAFDFIDATSFFTSTGFYGSARIKDTTTPANNYDSSPTKTASSLLTYTSPSVKMTMGPAGTLRFGAHNLFTASENMTSTGWSLVNSATATATVATDDSAVAFEIVRHTFASLLVVGATYALSFRVTKDSTPASTRFPIFRLNYSGFTDIDVAIDTSTGEIRNIPGRTYTTATSTDGGTYWQVDLTFTALDVGPTFEIYPAAGSKASISTVVDTDYTAATTGSVTVTAFHLRRTPSDSTYLATTSSSRISLPLEWNTSGVLQGVLVEEARTNLCLYSDDLTNAAWTKSNLTTAKTATGPDGVANSATTCTATAGNATALQAITSGSAARITSVWLRRRTGTGNIDVTQDNGSTWATQAITSSWARYNIASVTSTNPTVGIRVVTSGDAVDVALFDHEVGAFITSPIPTIASTVTRAADSGLTLATSAYPHSATVNSGWIEYVPSNVAAAMVALRWDDGTANEVVSVGHSAAAALGLTVTDGAAAQTAPLTSGTATAAATERIAFSWKANDFLFSDNGAAAVADTSGTLPTVTSLDFGPTLTGYIKRIFVVPVEKDAAEVATMATT